MTLPYGIDKFTSTRTICNTLIISLKINILYGTMLRTLTIVSFTYNKSNSVTS
jgi:hypothetical protein